jgi:two-component system, NtrC family, response regulator HydG
MMTTASGSSLILGTSRSFQQVIDEVDRYSQSLWPVLLLGETGVGKELIARRIHDRSPRKNRNFVAVNCAAIPPTLFESELFGFERGAFSGASQGHAGLLRSAHQGTLFLDEVGDLELASQVKLLRFLDSGELRRLGGVRVEHVDVRVVAATNVDLAGLVHSKKFRLDLLERLSVLTVRVPALRDRAEDIPAIARALLDKLKCRYHESVLEPLTRYEWPGNVRQLRNVLIRAGVLGNGEISETLIHRLLSQERAFAKELDERELWAGPLKDIEKRAILVRLKRNSGNRRRTAKDLGIAKSTLHEKLRQWRLECHEACNAESTDAVRDHPSVVSLDPFSRF